MGALDCDFYQNKHLQTKEGFFDCKTRKIYHSIDVLGPVFLLQDLQSSASYKILNIYLENIHAMIDDFIVGIFVQCFVENDIFLLCVHLENRTFVTIHSRFVYFVQRINEEEETNIIVMSKRDMEVILHEMKTLIKKTNGGPLKYCTTLLQFKIYYFLYLHQEQKLKTSR